MNKHYLEIKEFLEDTLVYLNAINLTSETSDVATLSTTPSPSSLNLWHRCKAINELFELEFMQNNNLLNTTNDDDKEDEDDDQPYLDMSGRAATATVESDKRASNGADFRCDYVDVVGPIKKQPQSSNNENLYQLLGSEKSDSKIDLNESPTILLQPPILPAAETQQPDCPFSGLPASHLRIKHCLNCGFVQRIMEKRFLFDKLKKYYGGIIDGWLLLYAGGLADLKPTICLCLLNFRLETVQDGVDDKCFAFQLISILNRKKYLFQINDSGGSGDEQKWINALKQTVNEPAQRQRFNSVSRKLPTPPPFSTTIRRTSDREDIYEEPTELLAANQHVTADNANQYDNVAATNLPKTVHLDPLLEYDVPKSPPKSIYGNDFIDHKVNSKLPSPIVQKSKTMRNWFLNRLSKSATATAKDLDENRPELNFVTNSTTTKSVLHPPPAGSKVNQIINQLETNGHLSLFLSKSNKISSGGSKHHFVGRKKVPVHYNYSPDYYDSQNYETVTVQK